VHQIFRFAGRVCTKGYVGDRDDLETAAETCLHFDIEFIHTNPDLLSEFVTNLTMWALGDFPGQAILLRQSGETIDLRGAEEGEVSSGLQDKSLYQIEASLYFDLPVPRVQLSGDIEADSALALELLRKDLQNSASVHGVVEGLMVVDDLRIKKIAD
jgi:hypothetical protein